MFNILQTDLRYLIASLNAPLSLKVVCLMSSKSLVFGVHVYNNLDMLTTLLKLPLPLLYPFIWPAVIRIINIFMTAELQCTPMCQFQVTSLLINRAMVQLAHCNLNLWPTYISYLNCHLYCVVKSVYVLACTTHPWVWSVYYADRIKRGKSIVLRIWASHGHSHYTTCPDSFSNELGKLWLLSWASRLREAKPLDWEQVGSTNMNIIYYRIHPFKYNIV